MKKILRALLVLTLVVALPIGAAMAGDAQKVTGSGIVHAESEGLWIGNYPSNTWSKENYEFDKLKLKYQKPDNMEFWVKNETKGNNTVQYKLYSENVSDADFAAKIDIKVNVANTADISSTTICDTTLDVLLSPNSENCTFEMDQQGDGQNNVKKVSVEMSLNQDISNDVENFTYDLAVEEYETSSTPVVDVEIVPEADGWALSINPKHEVRQTYISEVDGELNQIDFCGFINTMSLNKDQPIKKLNRAQNNIDINEVLSGLNIYLTHDYDTTQDPTYTTTHITEVENTYCNNDWVRQFRAYFTNTETQPAGTKYMIETVSKKNPKNWALNVYGHRLNDGYPNGTLYIYKDNIGWDTSVIVRDWQLKTYVTPGN